MMTAQYAEWLDTPVPALDGRSPRQAAGDPAMREQLEELLKAIEYMEERRRAGEPYIDITDLRRKLGLPRAESSTAAETLR
ncbi:MAG: antitoxin Xre/MbcA/ParS toxin-binding domain-containing protein [Anaerolineae bacterium]